jgi:hypothetical protein
MDDDALTIGDLDEAEAEELRESIDHFVSTALAKKGFASSPGDASKLFTPKASPVAAAVVAHVAAMSSGTEAHDATVAAQRAAVERNNVQTLADRAAGRAAEEFNGRLGGGRLTRPAGGKIEGKI